MGEREALECARQVNVKSNVNNPIRKIKRLTIIPPKAYTISVI
jgi:hypothetical protein